MRSPPRKNNYCFISIATNVPASSSDSAIFTSRAVRPAPHWIPSKHATEFGLVLRCHHTPNAEHPRQPIMSLLRIPLIGSGSSDGSLHPIAEIEKERSGSPIIPRTLLTFARFPGERHIHRSSRIDAPKLRFPRDFLRTKCSGAGQASESWAADRRVHAAYRRIAHRNRTGIDQTASPAVHRQTASCPRNQTARTPFFEKVRSHQFIGKLAAA